MYFTRAGAGVLFCLQGIFLGRKTVSVAEHGGKLRGIRKAAGIGNLRTALVVVFQKRAGFLQAELDQIGFWRKTVHLFKAVAKGIKAVAAAFGKVDQIDLKVVVFIQKAFCISQPVGMAWGREVQAVEVNGQFTDQKRNQLAGIGKHGFSLR